MTEMSFFQYYNFTALWNEPGSFFFLLQELAELVHKVHLLCLLARGRLIDSVCDDPLIQVDFGIL